MTARKKASYLLILSIGIGAFVEGGPARPPAVAQPVGSESVDELSRTLSRSISHPTILEFAVCQLQAAIWGENDAELRIGASAAVDGTARIFSVRNGKLSEEVDPAGSGGLASFSKKGLALIDSQEEAFKRGVPFFITDVTFEPPKTPTSLKYTVVSNPQLREQRGFARVKYPDPPAEEGSRYRVTGVELVDGGRPILSSLQPQKRSIGGEPGAILSLVRLIGGNNRCLVSNEVVVK